MTKILLVLICTLLLFLLVPLSLAYIINADSISKDSLRSKTNLVDYCKKVNVGDIRRIEERIYNESINYTRKKGGISVQYESQWDDFLLDGPWKIRNSDFLIPLLVGVISSDVELNDIYILDANDGDKIVASTNWASRKRTYPSPWFRLLYVDKSWFKEDNGKIAIKIKFDIYLDPFDNKEGPIYIDLGLPNLPKFSNWYCGDTHYHSSYTYTSFEGIYGELGAPIYIVIESGEVMGVEWVTITDHSNSFKEHESDERKWSNFKNDCDSYDRCLIGEEVNCRTPISGNWLGNSLPGNHYLSYDIQTALLDNGRDNVPYCRDRIDEVKTQGGFGYAAHPESTLDIYIADIITTWQNYTLPFVGLEIWNQDIKHPTKGQDRITALENGLEKWKNILLGKNGIEARRVFISAGSDAHGDLNKEFGKEYTCCYSPHYITNPNFKQNIFNSLENGKCYIGNNGALKFSISGSGTAQMGETLKVCPGNQISLNIDYNVINDCEIAAYKGEIDVGTDDHQIGNTYWVASGSSGFKIINDNPTKDSYYRVECINEADRIYTNPVWVELDDGACNGGNHSAEDKIKVYNDGTDTLNVNSITSNQDWVSTDLTSFSVNPGLYQEVTVYIDASNLDYGEYDAELYIYSDDPYENPKTIPIDVSIPCPDSDNDGICNSEDECPETPGLPEYSGCPDSIPPNITINSPLNGYVYNSTNISVDITTDELGDIFISWYSNEGSYNVTDMNFAKFTIEELEEGEHTLSVRAVDDSNNSASKTVNFGVCVPSEELCNGIDDDCDDLIDEGNVCGVEYSLTLYPGGWNIISLPLQPINTSLEYIIKDLSGRIIILEYDTPTSTWNFYHSDYPGFSTLTEMKSGKGYRILSDYEQNLTITGDEIVSTDIDLYIGGWNYVGYNSLISQDIISAISSLSGRIIILEYDTPTSTWKFYHSDYPGFSTLTEMNPGKGYLIASDLNQTWVI